MVTVLHLPISEEVEKADDSYWGFLHNPSELYVDFRQAPLADVGG
jgi:hypothetical protein